MFLEAEGALAASYAWQQLQPVASSLLEGVARLPKQLLGAHPPLPISETLSLQVWACAVGGSQGAARDVMKHMACRRAALPPLGLGLSVVCRRNSCSCAKQPA